VVLPTADDDDNNEVLDTKGTVLDITTSAPKNEKAEYCPLGRTSRIPCLDGVIRRPEKNNNNNNNNNRTCHS
jgi:hypothetical protein